MKNAQIPTFSKNETLAICDATWHKGARECFNCYDFEDVQIMVDSGMTVQDVYDYANEEDKEIILECLPIAITLGTDDDGEFVSMSVWAQNSVCLYESYILDIEESKEWLSRIEIVEGKKYYELNK